MEIEGKRFLVAGATGVLGGLLARELAADGARVALAGRDADRLRELGEELGAPTAELDFDREASAAESVSAASDALGGLDGIAVATGAVAFGDARQVDDAVVQELFRANAIGPISLINAALGRFESGGAVIVLSAVVADHPTAHMAAYSASKAAMSAYLAALRREGRRDGLVVLDVRPQHMDTGFADRALSGMPPQLPEPGDHHAVARQILDALRENRRELAYDLSARKLVAG